MGRSVRGDRVECCYSFSCPSNARSAFGQRRGITVARIDQQSKVSSSYTSVWDNLSTHWQLIGSKGRRVWNTVALAVRRWIFGPRGVFCAPHMLCSTPVHCEAVSIPVFQFSGIGHGYLVLFFRCWAWDRGGFRPCLAGVCCLIVLIVLGTAPLLQFWFGPGVFRRCGECMCVQSRSLCRVCLQSPCKGSPG